MKHLLLTTIAAVLVVGTALADPIHDAAGNGDLAGVQAELDKGVEVDAKMQGGYTPLHLAAREGQKELAELLIAKGADVNAKYKDGETPLDVATYPNNPNKNKAETAKLIRKHGGKTGEELKAEGK